jgi:mannose-6-phosphate isomerase-like protein (cupin superfamily)
VYKETIAVERSTSLRKNGSKELKIILSQEALEKIFVINGSSFITVNQSTSDLIVEPDNYYMVINKSGAEIEIIYNEDVSKHEIVYDPYRYEDSEKVNFTIEDMKQVYNIPEGHIDTLPKWYSFKFTYPEYNLIFVRPELGISIQTHDLRNEYWEILEGKPIIINGNRVYYFVESGSKFKIPKNIFHSVINPNQEKFVVLKERWDGEFDEEDIKRVHNPNHYK